MRSRIIKGPGSAPSDLRTTGCETMAWLIEVAEELNMYSALIQGRWNDSRVFSGMARLDNN